MANVGDVAKYILERGGGMTTMKLQKLCYYSQAWSLVWDEKPLFPEEIQAWANGPVCPELYHQHTGKFRVDADEIEGDSGKLSKDEKETVDAVLRFYGDMGAWELSSLTHKEDPWRAARGDLPQGAWCDRPITDAAMSEYYSGLTD
ncbi:hypothetical protein KIM372_10360 [Bombiscardovia nodaiensis]|uniref:Antitoxin SocA-like Panacea domain-containing protein n=1 Tax=Bombiscardovia nodaiensis TaxID=2932181 RepID=A0ABM8B8C8_9BIFI|nr:hypothetical protein KIM372_10360 [Bombiscardovia nodaiensis]